MRESDPVCCSVRARDAGGVPFLRLCQNGDQMVADLDTSHTAAPDFHALQTHDCADNLATCRKASHETDCDNASNTYYARRDGNVAIGIQRGHGILELNLLQQRSSSTRLLEHGKSISITMRHHGMPHFAGVKIERIGFS